MTDLTDAILDEIESMARMVLVKPDRETSATAYQAWLANIKKYHRAIEPQKGAIRQIEPMQKLAEAVRARDRLGPKYLPKGD